MLNYHVLMILAREREAEIKRDAEIRRLIKESKADKIILKDPIIQRICLLFKLERAN